jgi:NADH-quinone oxidoreductase subunit N
VIVVGSMISLGYYLPVIATMWMGEAPSPVVTPAIAGGSSELDPPAEPEPERPTEPGGRARPATLQLEVALVAVLAGAATLFFGIVPGPLFDLVRHAGAGLGLF